MTTVTEPTVAPVGRDTARPGGTWRVVRTELKRGSAPIMVLIVGGIGCLIVLWDPGEWAGRWYALTAQWRAAVGTMAAVAAALGTWQGGRATRRRTSELTASTARRPELRDGLAWIVAAVAAGVGSLVPLAVGAVLVAPVASYGGSWGWTAVGGVFGVMAFAAVGAAFGSRKWSALDPPLVVLVAFLVMMFSAVGSSGSTGTPASGLGPAVDNALDPGSYVSVGLTVAQVAWFAGAAALVVMLATAGWRRAVVAPAVLALAGAVGVVGVVTQGTPVPVDDGALSLVCQGSNPQLCLTREKAFVFGGDLPDLVRDQTSGWSSLAGAPSRLDDVPGRDQEFPLPAGVVQVDLSGMVDWRGRAVADADTRIARALADAIGTLAAVQGCTGARPPGQAADAAYNIASAWGTDPAAVETYFPDEFAGGLRRLTSQPADEQIEWIGRYNEAVLACDDAAIAALGEELTS